jgi:hypothetical protein
MGKGRFVNQKLAKRTGFAERQAAVRPPEGKSKPAAGKFARRAAEQRAIIGRRSSRRES